MSPWSLARPKLTGAQKHARVQTNCHFCENDQVLGVFYA